MSGSEMCCEIYQQMLLCVLSFQTAPKSKTFCRVKYYSVFLCGIREFIQENIGGSTTVFFYIFLFQVTLHLTVSFEPLVGPMTLS